VTGSPGDLKETSQAWAADIRNSVRDAIAQANDLSVLAQDLPRMLAQIDLEEVIADAPSLAFIANDLGGGREIVKNAPYTAEAVTESIQVLADGNRIVKRSTALLARDRYGRTRQERKGERGSSVYIYDPIEGRSYALNTERKTAVRIPRVPIPPAAPPPPAPPAPPEAPVSAPPAPPPPGPRGSHDVDVQPGRVIVRHGGAGRGQDADDVRVEVIRMGRGDGEHALPPMAPVTPFALPLMPRGKGETKSLGTRDFDGIKADGSQTTHTIPAGAIGNERPIVVATERWFSPELNVVVYAKTTDPRAGETTYRLVNVDRSEPSRDLFRIPDDYRVRGEPRPN
jgi:hypothetical protein